MSVSAEMLAKLDGMLAERIAQGSPAEKIMMSPSAFILFKSVVPRNVYRQRKGTRFINAYAGVPIELHDEWSWGWMIAPEVSPTQSAAA